MATINIPPGSLDANEAAKIITGNYFVSDDEGYLRAAPHVEDSAGLVLIDSAGDTVVGGNPVQV